MAKTRRNMGVSAGKLPATREKHENLFETFCAHKTRFRREGFGSREIDLVSVFHRGNS